MSHADNVTFKPDELHAIACALRVAAEQYSRDAVTAQQNYTALGGTAIARVAQQFETQARRALELAERIEQR
jgi:hypothetical protein